MLALSNWDKFIEDMNLAQTFADTTWIGWLTLLICVLFGLGAGKVLQTLLQRAAQRVAQRQWLMRGAVLSDLGSPVRLLILALALNFGLVHLAMSEPLRLFSHHFLALLYVIVLAWFCYNLVDLIDLALKRISRHPDSRLDGMVVPLVRKTLRVFILIVFALFTAGNIFGADISAWLAGLGIAGLAVSLAAQESIKNLFGSITIFLDRPFAIGDSIVFTNFEGAVEEIGLRSTRLRTADGQLITIPNSKFVDGAVQNNTRRPALRRQLNLVIPADTNPQKIEQLVDCLQQLFHDPAIAASLDLPDNPPRIFFDDFTPDGLNLKIIYWFNSTHYWAYLQHAQQINLRILRLLNSSNIPLAHPTRTLHITTPANLLAKE
jgi:MscS family membrane protein